MAFHIFSISLKPEIARHMKREEYREVRRYLRVIRRTMEKGYDLDTYLRDAHEAFALGLPFESNIEKYKRENV